MLSVGIDVGTTTTQLIFSRLILGGGVTGGSTPLSRSPLNLLRPAGIVDKQVIYQSEAHFTPLKGPDEIDATALEQILRREYQQAGITPPQVETGAVIITGETAKKRNADVILQAISALAGDFVVTVAGPHLESMISGRGAGAAAYSQEHYCTVTNVDIGGGSANSAIFRQGEMIAAAAMNYGGRILQVDPASGQIRHIADPARLILDYLDLPISPGGRVSLTDLRRFTDSMADLTVQLIEGTSHPLGDKLMLTAPSPVSGQGTILFFSGGIGLYFYDPIPINSVADAARHGDVGPLLAESLRRHPVIQSYTIRRPSETMRATVMGASSQTVTLSGSTIWAEAEILPIRNVPVVRALWPATPPTRRQVAQAVQAAITRWDVDPTEALFALALELTWQLDFNSLTELAAGLADFAQAHLPPSQPFIIIIEHDYARALGQGVKTLLPRQPLLVVDQVGLQEGDYIDIGHPLLDGRVVPLSVKTLIFYH
jgi:ethanolamine utilization protein EutA